MKYGTRSLVTVFLILVVPKLSVASNSCLSLFLPHDEVRITRGPDLPKEQTVTIGSNSQGRYGGRIVRLNKVGRTWVSRFAEQTFDEQGDPRFFIEAYGEKAAHFFGFKIISATEIDVPDAQEFNGALKKLNSALEHIGAEPIPFSFYASDSVKTHDYVRTYTNEGQLPFALSGNHFVHDVSFHTTALALPPALVRYQRTRIKYELAYLDHLSKKFRNDSVKSPLMKILRRKHLMNLTQDIDQGTGQAVHQLMAYQRASRNLGAFDIMDLKREGHQVGGSFKRAIFYFLGSVYSPKEWLESSLNRSLHHVKKEVSSSVDMEVAEDLEQFSRDFFAGLPSQHSNDDLVFNPALPQVSAVEARDDQNLTQLNGWKIDDLYRNRLRDIKDAIDSLESQ